MPDFPEPLAASRFRSGLDGWTIAVLDGTPPATAAQWAAVTDPAAIALDLTGACRLAAGASAATWFFAAPAALVANARSAGGGLIAFASVVPDPPARSSVAAAPDVVLQSLTASLGLRVTRATGTGPQPRQAWLSAGAGWVDLATGAAAAPEVLRSVLAGLTGLLIRGGPSDASAPSDLLTVELYPDPLHLLVPTPEAWFEGGVLTVAFNPSPFAAGYTFAVKDAQGGPAFSQTVLADALGGGIVALPDSRFTPADGTSYAVTVSAIGKAAPDVTAAFVELTAPVLSVGLGASGAHLSWPAVTHAASYDLQVASAGGGTPLVDRTGLALAAATLGTADGLTPATDYRARVRARAGTARGPWSNQADVRLPSGREILQALLDRMTAARTGASIPLDAAVLPPDTIGAPGSILAALSAALDGAAVTLSVSAEPALTGDSLTLDGTAALLGDTAAAVQAVFTVEDEQLRLLLTVTPSSGWRLSQGFDLAGTPWDELLLTGVSLVFTDVDRPVTGVASLKAGFNLAATLHISKHLQRLRWGGTPPTDAVQSRVAGPIQLTEAGTFLDLAAQDTLGELDLTTAGLPVQTVSGGLLTLTRAPGADGAAVDTLRIDGSASLSGTGCACTLDLPTLYADTLVLKLTVPSGGAATVATALSLAGPLSGSAAALIPWFGALSVRNISALRLRFQPEGGPIDLLLSIELAEALRFTSTVAIDQAHLDVHVLHDPAMATDLTDFRLFGQVTAGGQSVAIEASIPDSGDWTVSLAATQPVTIAALATIAGFDVASSLSSIPAPLRPAASVGLQSIVLQGQPNRALSSVQFEFLQTEDWSVGGVVTVKQANLLLSVNVARASVLGYLRATIVLGSGDKAVSFSATGPVPPAVGEPWTIAMDEGHTVTVPGIADLTGLFGGAVAAAPAGADQLAGLVVDGMLVRFDPASTPVLRQIAISLRQCSDWIIIGPGALVLSGLYGRFDYDNAGSALTLDTGGSVTILGTRIEARFRRPAPGSDWTLLAQTGTPIAASGVAAFDSWMNPAGIGGYLGTGAPFAGPARMGGVELEFAAADGALKRMALGFSLDLGWTLIPDKLTIDSLSAVLVTSMPVSTSNWTGTLVGDLTVFGAPVRLSASKATPASSWAFRGELAEIVRIDLAQSAASLTNGTSFLLPAGICSFGSFPSQISILSAEVDAIPDTGHFRFAGEATFTQWSIGLAGATFDILGIGGEILVEKTGDPVRARVTGELAFADAHIGVFVQLGSSAAVDTIVAGIVSPESIGGLSLANAVDSVAGTGIWSGAPLPQGYTVPGLSSAGFYLNLTAGVMAFYGRAGIGSGAAAYAAAALLIRKLPAASTGATDHDRYGYAFVLEVQGPFHFVDLVPASAPEVVRGALSMLDAALTLTSVSVAISSFDQPEGAGSPLAGLAPITPEPDAVSLVPAPPAPAATQIGRGLNIYGSIAFEGALWQAVKFVVDLTDAHFSFYGRLDPDDPAQTMFLGELSNATVLTYLHFDTLRLKYQSRPPAPAPSPTPTSTPAPTPYLAVGGAGALSLPGITAIDFTGWVVFDTRVDASGESARSASFDASVSVTETGLLGIPRVSLALSSIRMAWTLGDQQSSWQRTEFAIIATATLASFTFDAKIDLSDGTRQSIILSLDAGHSLSLQHLLVDGLGASWLDGAVPDLSFTSGSLSWTKPASGAASYALHAEATIIGFGFLFDATLTDGQGITGSAALASPIDFGFIRLTGPGQLNGPKVSLTSTGSEKTIALDSVIKLLDHDCTLHLAYTKPTGAPEPTYSGSISTPIDFGSLGSITPTLTLIYSESGGLDVKLDSLGIPWNEVKKFLNFVDMVEKAVSGLPNDPCRALGDLGLGPEAIQLTFNCGLAFPHLTPQSGSTPTSIDVDLVISYAIRLNVASYTNVIREAKMELGFLSIAIPSGGLTFANVAQSLITALVTAGPNIVKALFSDPEAMKTLAEMLVAQQASQALISNLVCRRTEKPGNDAESELEAGAEAAAAGTVEEAAAAFAAAFAITVGIISFLEGIWDALTGADKERKRKAEEQKQRAVDGIASLMRPAAATLAFTTQDTVAVSCTPPAAVADGNGATYVFTLYRIPADGGAPTLVQPRGGVKTSVDWHKGDPAPAFSIVYDGLTPGASYQVSVQALVSIDGLQFQGSKIKIGPHKMMGMLSIDGASSSVTSSTVRLPDCAVQSIALEQIGANVAAVVLEGNEVASSIVLQWLDQNGQVTGTIPATPPFAGSAAGARHALRLPPPAASGQFVLRATATIGTIAYQTRSAPLQVLDLPAPVLGAPQFDKSLFAVHASWSAVPNAGGYRLELLDDQPIPATIAQEDGPSLEFAISPGNRAGLVAQVRAATLPASGPGAVWSEVQSVTIPGAAVTLSLAAAAQGESPDGLAFTVRQIHPASSAVLTMSPGDSNKPVGTGAIAAFSVERSVPFVAGAGLLRRLTYAIDTIQPSIALSAPLDFAWPVPQGTTQTSDWALVLNGLPPLWHSSTSAAAMGVRLVDAIAAPQDRIAVASALDAAVPEASQLASVLMLSHDPETAVRGIAAKAQTLAARVAALRAGLQAIGQPLDTGTLARLLIAAAPAPTPGDLVDVLEASARADSDPVETLSAACRAAGLNVAQTAVQLHRVRPELGATQLAQALVAAFYGTSAYVAYVRQLLAQGLSIPVVGLRTLRLASAGVAPVIPDGLTLLFALLRAQGANVHDAEVHARSVLPDTPAEVMTAALTRAYDGDPDAIQSTVAALGVGLPQSAVPGIQQRLAWALTLAGVRPADLSPIVDAALNLTPDSGTRAAALLTLFAPPGADALRAQLVSAAGSPLAAVRANIQAFAPLSAATRIVLLVDAYPGLAVALSLVAAGLGLSGSTESEAKAALEQLFAMSNDAAAEAWAAGQSLIVETK